jgi:8-oxo-dGTP pyrophosphatase MutT (NUDIX family)
MGGPSTWPALAAARRRDVPRVRFLLGGTPVGSVAAAHLSALRAWPQWLQVDEDQVQLAAPDASHALAVINTALHRQGLIPTWRDETFSVVTELGAAPLARIERASARFWGSLTFGAHANGYVADGAGRATHLWIARRSPRKATDPGKLDNLIGGGVAMGQTPRQALVREGWEEAGLAADLMATARAVGVLHLDRDVHEGLQREDLHAFDLQLPPTVQPLNQDGEVAAFECTPVRQALQHAMGSDMTVDAALVTLDFARRHGLLEPALADLLAPFACRPARPAGSQDIA